MTATRRDFLTTAAAASYGRIQGANDRVRLGLIGYGLIGAYHVGTFKKHPDAQWVGVSDAYQPRIDAGVAACGPPCKGYPDFRQMLDSKEIDAVVVASPDHWHALMSIMACAAGKDVYVEKPMTLFVREGRWMVNAARRYKRIVQVGTQGRSGAHIPEVRSLFQSNHIGKIHSVRISTSRNIMPGFGSPANSEPPPGMNYDMWLGPAPERAYNPHRGIYHFRWFWDYSGGQMTNLGAHDLDFVYNFLDIKGPSAVYSAGGRFALTNDNGETPDTQDAILTYPGFTVSISIREACSGRRQGGGTEFFGTKGSMTVGRGGYQVHPDMRIAPERAIPAWSNPPMHPQPADIKPQPWTEARKAGGDTEPMELHTRNFLDCVKSRKMPAADVEQGHLIATACHLANISLRLGRLIRWDPAREDVIGDKEASSWLARPYRKKWDDVLKGFKL